MNDSLTPKAIVAALDEHIVGQDDAKKAVAVALRNRWRRQRLSARAARGSDAQEHPDDRADGMRQDRDQPAAGEARRRAVRQGRGDQVHRGRLCRARRRADRARPRRGSGAARARTPPDRGQGRRRGGGVRAPARRADRQGLVAKRPAPASASASPTTASTAPRSRSRSARPRRCRSTCPATASA